MSYVKLRTYWIDFVGNHNKYPIKSKAQYIVIDSVNGFSDIYEDPHSLIRQAYCLDIDTKEHETKTLVGLSRVKKKPCITPSVRRKHPTTK